MSIYTRGTVCVKSMGMFLWFLSDLGSGYFFSGGIYRVGYFPCFLFTVAAIACGTCNTGEPKILKKYGENIQYC
jgi:hypothetical protein